MLHLFTVFVAFLKWSRLVPTEGYETNLFTDSKTAWWRREKLWFNVSACWKRRLRSSTVIRRSWVAGPLQSVVAGKNQQSGSGRCKVEPHIFCQKSALECFKNTPTGFKIKKTFLSVSHYIFIYFPLWLSVTSFSSSAWIYSMSNSPFLSSGVTWRDAEADPGSQVEKSHTLYDELFDQVPL